MFAFDVVPNWPAGAPCPVPLVTSPDGGTAVVVPRDGYDQPLVRAELLALIIAAAASNV